MPTCNPITPAQPQEARYGIDKLYTSPRLTRATYKELYGEEAPAYDPKRRIKRWFFTGLVPDPETGLCKVTVFDATNRTVREMSMKESEVATPNLPGSVVWPKYVTFVPTPAVIVDPDGGTTLTMNGATLVNVAQAQGVVDEINAQLGKALTLVAAAEPWPWKIVWNGEPRRKMNITDGAQLWDAAAMLKNRFAKGVGSPGKWEDQGALGPVFVPETPNDGEQDPRPEIPMPCRPLVTNERIESGFGGLISIVRTDLTTDEPAPGTGGLTAEQDKLLRGIAAALGVKS